ncbi:MAG: BREX-1 system phosphatase PglZ type A [Bacteroidales bacterium]
MSSIEDNINSAFRNHRILFWYDKGAKFKEEFEQFDLEGVEKIEVQNNQFFVKYRLINEHNQRFLLYFDVAEPPYEENWLLDMQLAHRVFNSDVESIFLQDLGLEYHFRPIIKEHLAFFENKVRRAKLRGLLADGDSDKDILYKMLGVVFDVSFINLESFLQAYAQTFYDDSSRIESDLERYNLNNFFWEEVAQKFNYKVDRPSIYDFLLTIFKRNFGGAVGSRAVGESLLFIDFWKDSITYREAFRALSERIAKDLNVSDELEEMNYEDLLQDDLYKAIDFKIIHSIAKKLIFENISFSKVQEVVKKRENKYWYQELQECYEALYHASSMIHNIRLYQDVRFTTIEEGATGYVNELYTIDYSYRKFIFNYRKTPYQRVLSQLYEKVHKLYSNDWLLRFNDNWQQTIDNTSGWVLNSQYNQSNFFYRQVKPFIDKKQRLFVIISDALRYENGWELWREIQSKNRYEATLDYMITNLPSYTQLGMANLLPHEQLSIVAKDCTVMADGISSAGVQGRKRVLELNSTVRADAITAEKFMAMSATTEGREYVKGYDLIYIYHNHIDHIGDDKTSEAEVFDAVEREFEFLDNLLRHIANMNGNNMIITSDHGYIYQNEPLEESDFADAQLEGEIWRENRRFVLGQNLTGNRAVKKFNGGEVGLNSDLDILIPKGINRLRIKGSGSRYVHGGASLQEVVVPLLTISRKRKDTTQEVDIDIIQSSDQITTNVLAVTFIQKELITEKMLPRSIRAFIQADDGTRLSDIFNYVFDIEEGSERERSVRKVFQLSAAASGKYKGERVKLIIEQPIPNSNRWKRYAEHGYTLKISFINDFD